MEMLNIFCGGTDIKSNLFFIYFMQYFIDFMYYFEKWDNGQLTKRNY